MNFDNDTDQLSKNGGGSTSVTHEVVAGNS